MKENKTEMNEYQANFEFGYPDGLTMVCFMWTSQTSYTGFEVRE